MKKLSIAILLLLIAATIVGCGKTSQDSEVTKQPIPAGSVEKEDIAEPRMRLVKKLQHDLLNQDKMQTISLYVYEYSTTSPLSWTINVDGRKMLDLARDDYDVAEMNFMDIDGDERDEILIYRGSGGSSGAVGLNIYKPGANKWKELFAAKNLFDLPSKRFKMTYAGNYAVGFEDPETGLKATIPLVKERYTGIQNLASQITSWVDPISDYQLEDTNGDGVKEITTTQRVCGISHADTIALFKTGYKMQDQIYQAYNASVFDDKGQLLAQSEFLNNKIKIVTNVQKYSPLMSSVQGISMTPDFETNLKGAKVQYHWTAGSGNFLRVQNIKVKEIMNSGEKVLWIPEFQENTGNDNIVITLQAEDVLTRTILAETKLTIEQDDVFYTVKP